METPSRRSTRIIKHTLKLKEAKQGDFPEAVKNKKRCLKQSKTNTESDALRTKSEKEMKAMHESEGELEAITMENKSRQGIKSVTVSAIRVRLNDTTPNTEEQTRNKRKTTFNKEEQKSHTDNCAQLNKGDSHRKVRKAATIDKVQTSVSKHDTLSDVKYNTCKQARKHSKDRQNGNIPEKHDDDVKDLGEDIIVDTNRTNNENCRTVNTKIEADLPVDTEIMRKIDKRKRTVTAVMESTDIVEEGDTCGLDAMEPLFIEGGIFTDQSPVIESNSNLIHMLSQDIKSENSNKGKVIHIKVLDNLIGPNKSMFKEDGSCIDEDYLKHKYQNSKPLLEVTVKRENLDMINTGDEINIADNRVKNDPDKSKIVQQDVDDVDGEESDISESEGELSEYDEEKKINSVTCPVCSKVYSCKSNLMKHQALHNGMYSFITYHLLYPV